MTASGAFDGPWAVEFFQRSLDDDRNAECIAGTFLDSIPEQVSAEFHAVLDAVANGPPPSFRGGGKWEAMHGLMAGIFEIRVGFGKYNYRLFCLLVRNCATLPQPSIVCLGGLVKPKRAGADEKDYRLILKYRDEFQRHESVIS
jgi:hypothetical protein